MRRYSHFLPLIFVLFFYACCSCTEQLCIDGGSPFLQLSFNLDDYPELSVTDFDSIYVIRMSQDFSNPDSVLQSFFPADIGRSELSMIISLEAFFLQGQQISAYNFIIINPKLQQADTVSAITYDIVQLEDVCNECDGIGLNCQDETYIRNEFENRALQYNDQTLNSFEITYQIDQI